MIAVIIGLSRRIREAGRQGVLPWTKFWVSTRPFGTPLGPYFVIWALTVLLILAVPAGDAFTFGMCSNGLKNAGVHELTDNSQRLGCHAQSGVRPSNGSRYLRRALAPQEGQPARAGVQGLEHRHHLQHLHPAVPPHHALVPSSWRSVRW